MRLHIIPAFLAVSVGCSDEKLSAPPTDPVADTWSEIQAAIRTSPDHLPSEARRVAASRDPNRILAFVRDSFVPLPATATSFGDNATATRFGTRAAMRSGVATLREKAEILADLYRDAGFPAEVVAGNILGGAAAARTAIERPYPLTFSPDASRAQIERWMRATGATPIDAGPIDVDGGESDAIGNAVLAAIPDTAWTGSPFDWSSLRSWPLVRLTIDGGVTYANPHVPDASVGDTFTTTSPTSVQDAGETPTVQVTLWGISAANTQRKKTLAAGTWQLADVAGRQLNIAFVPTMKLKDMLMRPLESIGPFYPTISLHGIDVPSSKTAETLAVGGLVTNAGDIITMGDAGVTVNGTVVDSAPAPAATLARVTSISASATVQAFPEVNLRVAATDSNGRDVLGLTAGAFAVMEGGESQRVTVIQTRPRKPRVLFVLDTSSSIPAAYRGTSMAALVRNVATQLAIDIPGVEFRVAGVRVGLVASGDWTASPAVLEANANAAFGLGSDLWMALSAAASYGQSATVFITDGQPTDAPGSASIETIGNGPPAVFIGVGTVNTGTLTALAAASHGSAVLAASTAEAAIAARGFARAFTKGSYVLRYVAPRVGGATRTVTVGIANTTVQTTTTYKVPDSPALPVRLASVGIDVRIGNKTVTRVLAGPEKFAAGWTASPESIDEMTLAMFGNYTLAFEGGSPTTAMLLDEWLTSRISKREATKKSTLPMADRLALFEKPSYNAPQGALMVQPELPRHRTGAPLTFESGTRATLQVKKLQNNQVVNRLDILPFTEFATMTENRLTAFRTTARRSARLAIAEEAGPTNAVTMLKGKALVAVLPYTAPPFTGALKTTWDGYLAPNIANINVIPADGSVAAYHTIDPRTGTLIGIVPGVGGACEFRVTAIFDSLSRVYDIIGAGVDIIGGPVWIGIMIELQKAQMAAVAIATAALEMVGGYQQMSVCALSEGMADMWDNLTCGIALETGLEAAQNVIQALRFKPLREAILMGVVNGIGALEGIVSAGRGGGRGVICQ